MRSRDLQKEKIGTGIPRGKNRGEGEGGREVLGSLSPMEIGADVAVQQLRGLGKEEEKRGAGICRR